MSVKYYNKDGKQISVDDVIERHVSFQQHLDNIFLDSRRNRKISRLSYHQRSISSLADEMENLKQKRFETQERIKNVRICRPKTTFSLGRKVEFNMNVIDVDDEQKLSAKPDEDMAKKRESKPTDVGKRQTFGLKVAVADFSQKVLDNVGTNITTYAESDNESDENQKQRSERILSSSYALAYTNKILNPIEKFRRAIKTINLLLKATTTNAEQSKKHEQKYLIFPELKADAEDDSKKTIFTELTFNLSEYKAKREAKLNADAISIMKRHQSLRSEENIHFVIMALNSTVEAFGEFPINMQEAIVRHGWYEKFGPKRVIIRQSQAARNFYFIISGKTMVVVARKHNTSGESYGETVAFLKKGNSFGELALMYGGKRSASVVCVDDVELLSVTREDFIEIFMNLSTDTEPKHIQFLRSISILQGWPIDSLPYDDPRICMFTYFRKGTVLCRDSIKNEWVYVVCSGSCKVIKSMNEVNTSACKVDRDSGRVICRYKTQRNEEKSSKVLYIQLNVLRQGEIFGLESIAFGQLGSTTSVTFVSEGSECIAIDKKFFCDHMSESYMKRLRYEIQPFPFEEELRKKLQNYVEWKMFRKAFTEGYKEF